MRELGHWRTYLPGPRCATIGHMARTEILRVRLTLEELQAITEKAAAADRSLSDWARLQILGALRSLTTEETETVK